MASNDDEVDCIQHISSDNFDSILATTAPQQESLSTVDINALHAEILRRVSSGTPLTIGPTPSSLAIKAEPLSIRRPPEPSVEIVEEPRARGLRFRYKCEGRSAGSLPGENSTNEQKTYPTIKINNFSGPAAIVVVSCVTKDKPYCPHPHNLVGQDCRDGVCTVKVRGRTTVSFPNIGIQCCKRHDVEESLKLREKIRVDPFGTGYFRKINDIDLNSVRLCFQVFLPDANKKFTHIVQPVVSQPIIDKKSIHDLVICRLSRQSGYASGGDEVFLLCEKINKDDIQVRFFEETEDGVSWEAFGDFASHDVHRQYAIVFRTPPYRDPYIQSSVQVFIQLRRPSDDETGDPKPFQYIPQDPDPYGISNKRKRKEVTVDTFYNNDRIPLSVWHEVKDDPESGNVEDVKSRLKKKAVSGLQRKDNQKALASSASAATADRYPAGPQQAPVSITTHGVIAPAVAADNVQTILGTAPTRHLAPGTPIVLSAEALTSLLASHMMMTQQQQQQQQQADFSTQVLQYLADQSAGGSGSGTITLSLDSLNIPNMSSEVSVTSTATGAMVDIEQTNDLEVGAQEMVHGGGGNGAGDEELQKQHPLHLN